MSLIASKKKRKILDIHWLIDNTKTNKETETQVSGYAIAKYK